MAGPSAMPACDICLLTWSHDHRPKCHSCMYPYACLLLTQVGLGFSVWGLGFGVWGVGFRGWVQVPLGARGVGACLHCLQVALVCVFFACKGRWCVFALPPYSSTAPSISLSVCLSERESARAMYIYIYIYI